MALESSQYLPAVQPSGLQGFLRLAYQTPVLSREEEVSLFECLQLNDDVEAARKLVLSNMRYVVYIARSYTGYGLPLEDLIQQGSLGLMKSVKRFDLQHGVRLVSYAVHWIKAEIHDYILKNWRIVKIATTKAQRKLFFNLRKSKARLGWANREEVETIARDLGVKPEDVLDMESRLAGTDDSCDPVATHDEEPPLLQLSYERDQNPEVLVEAETMSSLHTQGLTEGMAQLDDRSLDIIQSRFLTDEKVSLKDLSERYQVSIERIRQIEARSLQKLRPFLQSA